MAPREARAQGTWVTHVSTQYPSAESDPVLWLLHSHLPCGGTVSCSPASQAGGAALGTLLRSALLRQRWRWIHGRRQQLGGSQALEVIEG